tara:strand:- start:6 stop:248 length:243 start_codon:yes stop_codon:yes gene_type:complete
MEPNDNNDILKNINDIEYKVKELEKEKEIIQDNCKHKEWTINFNEQRSIKRYCSECKMELGYATKQEEQNFLKPKGSKNT